jgi:predicted Zn-dependent protease
MAGCVAARLMRKSSRRSIMAGGTMLERLSSSFAGGEDGQRRQAGTWE